MTEGGTELRALREHPFGQALAEPQLERLFRCGAVMTLEAGAFVFHEGETADRLYLVRSGRIALEQHVPGRETVQMESLQGGDVLGFSWMFEGERWTLDARAVQPTELFALDGPCMRQEMQEDPGLGLVISTQLIHQLYHRLERVRLQRLDAYRAEP